MYTVLLTIHILVTIFLIGIILMQRSSSDGMGLSGSSSSSFLSGRAAANAVTRATAILAALFILTSLGLGILTARSHVAELSITDRIGTTKSTPATTQAPATPAKPAVPRPE